MQRRWGSVGAAALLVGLVACGSDETGTTGDGDVAVTREGEGVRITSEEQEFEGHFGPGAELPDDFPDDVPLPPEAEVVGSMASPRDGAIVSLRSGTEVDALVQVMREGLVEHGWSVEEQTNVMGQRVLPATKGERSLVVQISEREGASQVMVHVAAAGDDEGS